MKLYCIKNKFWSLKIVGERQTSSESFQREQNLSERKVWVAMAFSARHCDVLSVQGVAVQGLWLLFQLGPPPGIFLHLCLAPYKIYQQEVRRTQTLPC